VFPACWGDRINVLVVGGTSLDGRSIWQQGNKGSNSGQAVHIVAPATGYYAAGRAQAYVPVAGTSFATPLVTATAALLSAMGVTQPASIKQRIIATADFDAGLPEWARRLNITRAVLPLDSAVRTTRTDEKTVISLTRLNHMVQFTRRDGRALLLPVRQILRLTQDPRDSSRYILVSSDADKGVHIDVVKAPTQDWTFFYCETDPQNPDQITSQEQRGNLAEYKDYVGPVSR
jgi:hypothetical protein